MRLRLGLLALPVFVSITLQSATSFADDSLPVATDETEAPTPPPLAGVQPIRNVDAPVATDPPSDWAVAHAGLEPRLGTFGGIGTFAVARADTEHFYGGVSFAGVRNDAHVHAGVGQLRQQ